MGIGTAVITGATSGIGAEFTRQLAARGCDLVLTGRRRGKLDSLAAELQKTHAVAAEVITGDLAQPEGVEAVEKRIAATPTLAFLINNASFGVVGKFASADLQKQLDMIQVHVTASVQLTHTALPGMLARKQGAIVNFSLLSAYLPHSAGSVTYTATKTYLNVFPETLHEELRGSGVRIQALCPGMTYTEFHDRPGFEHFKRSSIPAFAWMTAERVVTAFLRALARDQVICVPGFVNHLVATFGGSALVAWVINRVVARPSRI
jgi:short-subunit dehydrogenase